MSNRVITNRKKIEIIFPKCFLVYPGYRKKPATKIKKKLHFFCTMYKNIFIQCATLENLRRTEIKKKKKIKKHMVKSMDSEQCDKILGRKFLLK